MINRFSGDEGRPNLIEALILQPMVAGNRELAAEIANRAELVEIATSERLITQDADDNDLFLILAGSFDVVVNGRKVAVRGRGDHVGEMVFVEPTQLRSADVIAAEDGLVAKLSHSDANKISEKYPQIYKVIAKILSRRLLERNKMVGPYREQIKVFIISSSEALEVARAIQTAISAEDILVTVWTDGLFKVSSYVLEILEKAMDDADFAIAIAHSDDVTIYREQNWPTPRDNVILELGMFMGRLGRSRAILMEPKGDAVRLPTDLKGITTIRYTFKAGRDSAAHIAPACNILRDHVREWGPFNG
jgi:predicted nucleotide-binding protein